MTLVNRFLIVRQCRHLFDGGGIGTAVEVVVHRAVVVLRRVRVADEAVGIAAFSGVEIKVGGNAAILHVLQRHRHGADAVLGWFGAGYWCFIFGGSARAIIPGGIFHFGNEGFGAAEAVEGDRLDARILALIGISQVITTKDAGGGVVVVFPLARFLVVVQLLTEGIEATADTHQPVGGGIAVFFGQLGDTLIVGAIIGGDCIDDVIALCFTASDRVFKGGFRGRPPHQSFAITGIVISAFIYIICMCHSGCNRRFAEFGVGFVWWCHAAIGIDIFTVDILTGVDSAGTVAVGIHPGLLPSQRLEDRSQSAKKYFATSWIIGHFVFISADIVHCQSGCGCGRL